MPESQFDWLAARGKQRAFDEGAAIFDSDQHPEFLYVILQGSVQGERIADPRASRFHELRPGEWFPLGALLANRTTSTPYICLEDTLCLELSRSDFEELLSVSPTFQDYCNQFIAREFARARQWLREHDIYAGFEQHEMMSPLSSVMSPPVSCSTETPIKEVLDTLNRKNIGSMIVTNGTNAPVGIFALPDVVSRVFAGNPDLNDPIAKVMSPDPVSLPPQAPIYEAALLMQQHRVRHVPIVESGELKGIVSERDLFRLQRVSLQLISEAISRAENHERLITASRDIRQLGRDMLAQGVAVAQITSVISRLNDQLSGRLIEISRLRSAVGGTEFCWIALGSEGRNEQTLSSDQDNGIIFAVPEGGSAKEIRNLLVPFARGINEALADYGFPLCKGNIMASNPEWCLALFEWKDRFATWIDQGDPESLLNATIFFDFRPIYGESRLAENLRQWLSPHAQQNRRFLHQMAANAMRSRPPLGWLRGFTPIKEGDHADTIDIKMNGTTLFVDAARIYSLQAGVTATNTDERLRLSASRLNFVQGEVEAWIDAFHFIRWLRLKNESEHPGIEAGHYIRPAHLNSFERETLRQALLQARRLRARLALDYEL
jgi:CBS domain-containing protein